MEVKVIEILPTDGYFQFKRDQLSIVRKICNMGDPGRIKQAIEILRDWQNHGYFNKNDHPDVFFEKLLIVTKGSVERAKSRYEKHCTLKTIWPQYFIPTDINYFRKDFELISSILLPDVTEDGCRVSLSKIHGDVRWTADLLIRFSKYVAIISEYAMAYDYPNGFVVVLDYRFINLIDALAFVTRHVTLLQHCVTIMIEGYGMRVKGIHLVTPSKAAGALVTFLKQLVTAKVSSRIHAHKDTSSLLAYVPKKILPADLGGDAPPLIELEDSFLKALDTKDHREWMREAQRATINQSMVPTDHFNRNFIGMPGAFRTLNVD